MSTASDLRRARRDPARVRFAQNLRQCRLERGLTQSQLAEHVGVDRSLVARWEAGQRDADLPTLEQAAAALRVPVSRLARGVTRLPANRDVCRAELQALGVPLAVDWSSPPWVLRPVETTLADALLRPDPRVVDYLPGVLATTRFEPRLLWASANTPLAQRRLGWASAIAAALLDRGMGANHAPLEGVKQLMVAPPKRAEWDSLGRPIDDHRKLPPISKRWRISYDQNLRGFLDAGHKLTVEAG